MNKSLLIHAAVETLVFAVVSLIFFKKLNGLKQEVDQLKAKVASQEVFNKQCVANISEVYQILQDFVKMPPKSNFSKPSQEPYNSPSPSPPQSNHNNRQQQQSNPVTPVIKPSMPSFMQQQQDMMMKNFQLNSMPSGFMQVQGGMGMGMPFPMNAGFEPMITIEQVSMSPDHHGHHQKQGGGGGGILDSLMTMMPTMMTMMAPNPSAMIIKELEKQNENNVKPSVEVMNEEDDPDVVEALLAAESEEEEVSNLVQE